jgi:hypothetical protein
MCHPRYGCSRYSRVHIKRISRSIARSGGVVVGGDGIVGVGGIGGAVVTIQHVEQLRYAVRGTRWQ